MLALRLKFDLVGRICICEEEKRTQRRRWKISSSEKNISKQLYM